MTGDTTPQQQAARLLVDTFKAHHAFGPAEPRDHSTLVVFQEEDGSSMRALSFGEIIDCLADAGLLCSSPEVQPEDGEGSSLRSSEPSAAGQVVSYDELVDWVIRLEVTVKPVNGVVNIVAESMADAFADFLRLNGIEVSRG